MSLWIFRRQKDQVDRHRQERPQMLGVARPRHYHYRFPAAREERKKRRKIQKQKKKVLYSASHFEKWQNVQF